MVGFENVAEYLVLVAEKIAENGNSTSLLNAFGGLLDAVRQRLEVVTLGDLETILDIDVVIVFTRRPVLAMVNALVESAMTTLLTSVFEFRYNFVGL